jgi:hypothetical protein
MRSKRSFGRMVELVIVTESGLEESYAENPRC